MLDRHEIDHTIVAAVARVLCIPEREIEPETTLFDLGADSLDILDMLFRLEKQFGIEIAMPVRESMTIEDISCFVREHAPCTDSFGEEDLVKTH